MKLYKQDWVVDNDTKQATNEVTHEVVDFSQSLEQLPFLVAQMIREWRFYF